MNKVGVARLREDAARFYKDMFARPTAEFTPLKPVHWPASFHEMRPLQVGVYRDGFTLTFYSKPNLESGLYVVPLQMDHIPAERPNVKYEPVVEGIYWYSFTH